MHRAIALGFFDGVHLGHGELLKQTAAAARNSGIRSCALTFDKHPEKLISGFQPPLLGTVNDRCGWMRRLYGIEEILILPFDESLMRMPWRDFFRTILCERFGAAHLAAGEDFHFGYRNEGNVTRLAEECAAAGVGFDVVSKVVIDGITVSSTYIRGLAAQGDMERARQFLGHPHAVTGKIVHGRHIGTTLGFPTANITLAEDILVPAKGVYMSNLVLDNVSYPAMTNIGVRPTLTNSGELTAETCIFDFEGDLYGQSARIELLKMVRPEIAFMNTGQLKAQIEADAKAVRALHFQEMQQKSSANTFSV